MKKRLQYAAVSVLSLVVLTGMLATCGEGTNFNPRPNSIDADGGEVSADVKKFRDDAVALQRRAELDLDELTIQYVLVATGVDGFSESKPNLTLPEAERLAADVYKQALADADFDKLVLTHSYGNLAKGQRPGMFTLLRGLGPEATLPGGPNTFRREQEEDAVARAAWRLQPGEIGPVERHEKDANSGYYVVRRLTEDEIKQDDPTNSPPANDAVKAMREEAKALMARDEHGAKRVEVQHILIGRFFSNGDGSLKRLSAQEAEALAAEVYAKAKAGEDFSALVREYTYDQAAGEKPGAYTMVADRSDVSGELRPRDGMIPAFGDTAWRLAKDEIGVVLYHRNRSHFGYHIMKRIE